MTMITPSYLGETIEYSSLHACRSTLEDPTVGLQLGHGLQSFPLRDSVPSGVDLRPLTVTRPRHLPSPPRSQPTWS